MPQLVCENGHLVLDDDAVRCPECNEYVRTRSTASSSGSLAATTSPGPSQPMSLLLASVGLALLTGLILGIAQGNGFGIFLAALAGFVASTMWLVGCIAMGVRIGQGDS